jgi:hypothetical protein
MVNDGAYEGAAERALAFDVLRPGQEEAVVSVLGSQHVGGDVDLVGDA